ncbi:MAG: response regulator, partial [Lachnospiraceae bacterium]|nr:response regulator [Lachnospiraceae bacterium]
EEDFDYILSADKTDVIFICDDEQTVLYQNKAASINSQLFKDVYIGRRLKDIFIIDRDVERAMKSKDARNGLMVPAIYPITKRNIVISVEYIYDCVDEILYSIITIPNYEVALDENTFVDSRPDVSDHNKQGDTVHASASVQRDDIPLSDKDKMAVDINSNILLVDEDLNNLSLYEKYFRTYDIKINRAAGGRAALSKMLEPCYDAVFIAYNMERLNGVETAKRIRNMGGEYYNDVPIIFILDCPVADVYKDLLEVSFNDFIEMPISSRKLNTIMTRWLWRRYAITDREDYDSVGQRIARFMDNLEQLCSDCQKACNDQKWEYIGYMLKGMKRLCGKLEVRSLTSACDSVLDLYINERYDELPFMLTSFNDELESIRDSGNISIKY